CFGGAVGDSMVCEADSILMKDAYAACSAKGDSVTSFIADEGCGTGGGSHLAKYECCPSSTAKDAGPGDASSTCFDSTVGSSTMKCEADGTLEKEAYSACAAKGGGTITGFSADEACGMGSSLSAKFECCPSST